MTDQLDPEAVKPFAQFLVDKQFQAVREMLPTMVKFVDAMAGALSLDADGKIEDDYFRGMTDGLKSTVEGIGLGLDQMSGEFDSRFDYIWYQWEKSQRDRAQ